MIKLGALAPNLKTMKKHTIKLSKKEKKSLRGILHTGSRPASVRNRAQVLFFSDKGIIDETISDMLGITVRAICNIRRNYCEKGLDKCIFGEKRSGRPREISTTDETELVALACSAPPEGRARWTLDLLKKNTEKKIGKSSIHLLLKKTGVNLGSKKCGVSEN